jgi:hypothetical protein
MLEFHEYNLLLKEFILSWEKIGHEMIKYTIILEEDNIKGEGCK